MKKSYTQLNIYLDTLTFDQKSIYNKVILY